MSAKVFVGGSRGEYKLLVWAGLLNEAVCLSENFLFCAGFARDASGFKSRSINPRSCFWARVVEMPMNNVPMATIIRTSANVPKRARSCKENFGVAAAVSAAMRRLLRVRHAPLHPQRPSALSKTPARGGGGTLPLRISAALISRP